VKAQSAGETDARESGDWKSTAVEYAKSIVVALILALCIRTFVVQAYEIPSGSMENTLAIGDHILVNKFIYGTEIPIVHKRVLTVREPTRGDVIVFKFPEDRSKDFIKRLIGLPGDQIRIVDKKVYVNDQVFDDHHELYKDGHMISADASPRDNMSGITVPSGCYFVMGDNRDNSYDSRFWGFVRRSDIEGLAFIKYWSWDSDHWRVRWGSIGTLID